MVRKNISTLLHSIWDRLHYMIWMWFKCFDLFGSELLENSSILVLSEILRVRN